MRMFFRYDHDEEDEDEEPIMDEERRSGRSASDSKISSGQIYSDVSDIVVLQIVYQVYNNARACGTTDCRSTIKMHFTDFELNSVNVLSTKTVFIFTCMLNTCMYDVLYAIYISSAIRL